MAGSVRSYLHYIELRTGNGTQLEHKLIAEQIKAIFCKEFPVISKAMNW
jgi:thymidylate synthase (FAD)